MANSYNRTVLIGNVVRDTEVRQAGNTSVTDNTIAVTERFADKEVTSFVDITLWGKNCDVFQRHCPKGRTVLIEGSLRQDKWEDKETGAKRSKLFVNVDKLVLIGSKPENQETVAVGASGSDELPF